MNSRIETVLAVGRIEAYLNLVNWIGDNPSANTHEMLAYIEEQIQKIETTLGKGKNNEG